MYCRKAALGIVGRIDLKGVRPEAEGPVKKPYLDSPDKIQEKFQLRLDPNIRLNPLDVSAEKKKEAKMVLRFQT